MPVKMHNPDTEANWMHRSDLADFFPDLLFDFSRVPPYFHLPSAGRPLHTWRLQISAAIYAALPVLTTLAVSGYRLPVPVICWCNFQYVFPTYRMSTSPNISANRYVILLKTKQFHSHMVPRSTSSSDLFCFQTRCISPYFTWQPLVRRDDEQVLCRDIQPGNTSLGVPHPISRADHLHICR